MQRYGKELIIMVIQVMLFYLFPMAVGSKGAILMVLLLLMLTFVLSLTLACISKNKVKYFYPVAAAILFIPSVFIYYNSSALIHAVWYFAVSAIGMGIGAVIAGICNKRNS